MITISKNNWGVCSAGNFAKKIVAIFTYAPLIFIRKMWKMHFSSEIFSGWGWLSENPFQIPEMLTWQNREMHYKRVFKWSRVIFITNRSPIFTIFPHFRLQFTANPLHPKVSHRAVNQLNIKINFSHPKGTSLRRTASYDVLSVKIGPTGTSTEAWKKRKKWSGHSKVLGAYLADWPLIFSRPY